MSYRIRPYTPADETAWLRCRVLAFLDTAFYDSVLPAKPSFPAPSLELVVLYDTDTDTDADSDADAVVAVLDAAVEGELATIDTIAVHPDHRRHGLGRLLLDRVLPWARAAGATTLDAWTRDDADTLAWYHAMGFAESEHYVHAYAFHYTDPAEPARAVTTTRPGLFPIHVFLHAPLDQEARLRTEFARVHVDRRFSQPL